MSRATQILPDSGKYLIVLFDLSQAEAVDRLYREWAAWREFSDSEALSENCFALILRPGVAERLAA
jgi:hypothetical protein